MKELGLAARRADPDPELARRAAAGDEAALELLIRESYPRVHRWALVATGDPSEADDVTQEALIRVLRGLAGWKGEGRFTTWLYRITANAALERGRRRGRREGREVTMDEAASVAHAEEDPGGRVDRERVAVRLREAFLTLPRRQREVLDLADLQGFTGPEIAEMLGLAKSSVRVTLLLARRALRSRIADLEGDLT